MKSSNIGGQAVLEGIMMKNKTRYAVAVRKPDQQIEVCVKEYKGIIPWQGVYKVPFIRGIFNFIDSLVLGMKTLTYSASFFEEEEGEVLTIPQQKAFMDYLKAHREYQGWVPIITVLLGTGMRIGECIGLRWDDLDFEKRIVSVNHTFIYRPDENRKSVKHISTPKTISGRRTIPMIDEVFNAFLDEYEIQKCIGFSSEEIDGYSNFVFVTATGTVYLPNAVNRAIERARVAYNKDEIEIAEKEDREPLIIPHFSAHHLRHTFCTRLCENESNLKVIQSIMGHSDITTTMDVYAEATQEKKQEIVANLQGKIII